MKFNFKIQQFQTDAVDAVVKVFQGQGYHDRISYIRDVGKKQANQHQGVSLIPFFQFFQLFHEMMYLRDVNNYRIIAFFPAVRKPPGGMFFDKKNRLQA